MTDSRSIRIFLSSTFRDLQRERSYLVKTVIPSLKQYGKEHNVDVSVVDLRWGVTESESRTGKVLEICFDEITRTKPYFIGIIGSRYGWTPQEKDIPNMEHLSQKFPWLKTSIEQGLSITEMEMQYGVLKSDTPVNAAFFINDTKTSKHESTGGDESEKLARLKMEVRAAAQEGRCTVDDFDSPETLGRIFAERVRGIIDAQFPDTSSDDDLRLLERQQSFLDSLRTVYREGNMDLYIGEDDMCGDRQIIAIVSGESGIGKTAFLANIFRDGVLVYEHYDATDDETTEPTTPEQVTVPVVHTLLDDQCSDLPKCKTLLDKSIETRHLDPNAPLLWIIDGFERIAGSDRLDNEYRQFIRQLPPSNIKIIISTSDDALANDIKIMARLDFINTVEPLDDSQVYWLLEAYLSKYSKRLDDRQLMHILGSPLLRKPVILKLFIAELIQVGEFERLNQWIDYYLEANNEEELMQRIFQRMENDFGKENVGTVLSLMAGSPIGIPDDTTLLPCNISKLDITAIVGALDNAVSRIGNTIAFRQQAFVDAALHRYVNGKQQRRKANSLCRKMLRRMIRSQSFLSVERDHMLYGMFKFIRSQYSDFRTALFLKLHPLAALGDAYSVLSLIANKWINPFFTPIIFLILQRGMGVSIRSLRKGSGSLFKMKESEEELNKVYLLLYESDTDKLNAALEKNQHLADRCIKGELLDEDMLEQFGISQYIIALQRLGRWDESRSLIASNIDNVNIVVPLIFALLDQTVNDNGDISVCRERYDRIKENTATLIHINSNAEKNAKIWEIAFNTLLFLFDRREDQAVEKAVEQCRELPPEAGCFYTVCNMVTERKEMILNRGYYKEQQYYTFIAEIYSLRAAYEKPLDALHSLDTAATNYAYYHKNEQSAECCDRILAITEGKDGEQYKQYEYNALATKYNLLSRVSQAQAARAEEAFALQLQIAERMLALRPRVETGYSMSVLHRMAGDTAKRLYRSNPNSPDANALRDKAVEHLIQSYNLACDDPSQDVLKRIVIILPIVDLYYSADAKPVAAKPSLLQWLQEQLESISAEQEEQNIAEYKSKILVLQGRFNEAMDILSGNLRVQNYAQLVHQALEVVEIWDDPDADTRPFPLMPAGAVPRLEELCQVANDAINVWAPRRLGQKLLQMLEQKYQQSISWSEAKVLALLYKALGDQAKGNNLLQIACDEALHNKWNEELEIMRFTLQYNGIKPSWENIATDVLRRQPEYYESITTHQCIDTLCRLYAGDKCDYNKLEADSLMLNRWAESLGEATYFWIYAITDMCYNAERAKAAIDESDQGSQKRYNDILHRCYWQIDIIVKNKFNLHTAIENENDNGNTMTLEDCVIGVAEHLADLTLDEDIFSYLYDSVFKPLGLTEADLLPPSMQQWYQSAVSEDYLLTDEECQGWLDEYNNPEITADMVRTEYRIQRAYENTKYDKVIQLWPQIGEPIKRHASMLNLYYADSLARCGNVDQALQQLHHYLNVCDDNTAETLALRSFILFEQSSDDDAKKLFLQLQQDDCLPNGIDDFAQWRDYVYGIYKPQKAANE